MTDFTNDLTRLIASRDFSQVRTEIADLDTQQWIDEMLSPDVISIFRDAIANRNLEGLSALMHNQFRNARFGTQRHDDYLERERNINELIAKSVSIPRAPTGGVVSQQPQIILEALDLDRTFFDITEKEISERFNQVAGDDDIVELAEILIARRNRGFEILDPIWSNVLPHVPSILHDMPTTDINRMPNNLWLGVFMEMVWDKDHEAVSEMIYELDEDVRRNLLLSPVYNRVLSEANDYEDVKTALVVYNARQEIDIPQQSTDEELFGNELMYDDIATLITTYTSSHFRAMIFSNEGIAAFADKITADDDDDEVEVVKMVLNALKNNEDRLTLLTTILEDGSTLFDRNDEPEMAQAMLDSLTPENQTALILSESGKTAFDWMVRQEQIDSVNLMLGRLSSNEQRQELIESLSEDLEEIFNNLTTTTEELELPDSEINPTEVEVSFYEETKDESEIPSVHVLRPRTPEENQPRKSQRLDNNNGEGGPGRDL